MLSLKKFSLLVTVGALSYLASAQRPATAQMSVTQIRELTGVEPERLELGGRTLSEWQSLGQQGITPALLPGFSLGRADIIFGNAEGGLQRTISGSYKEGFAVPCWQNCAHIELGAPYTGLRWVSGLSQQVRGGHGMLASLNNGWEPTGRHPFGSSVKVVLLETDESSGTANMGLYFRTCISKPIDLGCSPYFIGPLPWLRITEQGFLIL